LWDTPLGFTCVAENPLSAVFSVAQVVFLGIERYSQQQTETDVKIFSVTADNTDDEDNKLVRLSYSSSCLLLVFVQQIRRLFCLRPALVPGFPAAAP
jgi:hypothetical protein